MQHLPTLGQIAEAHARANAAVAANAAPLPAKGKDRDLSFLEGGETFKFLWAFSVLCIFVHQMCL